MPDEAVTQERKKVIDAIREAIVKDGDTIVRVATRAGVVLFVFFFGWAFYLLTVPVAQAGKNTAEVVKLVEGHVKDQDALSEALKAIGVEMRRHGNQLAQECSNSAGANEEKRARCFDVLNGATPR